MPFLFPPAVQSAHLNNFSQRLIHHLQTAPTSLMGVQEAFCKAGGYPNAHAAQHSRQQQQFLFIPVENNHSVDVLPSVPTKHLFEWAKQAWKKHRSSLSNPTVTTIQSMLLSLWGYERWEDIGQRPLKNQSPFSQHLLRAATLDQLCNQDLRSHTARPSGLYLPLGQQDGQWIGTSVSAACCHTLVYGPIAEQAPFLSNLAIHRMRQGDTLLVFLNEHLSKMRTSLKNAAHNQGQKFEYFASNSAVLVPAYIERTRKTQDTTRWLHEWINSERNPIEDSQLINWLDWVAHKWLDQWDGSAHNTLSLLLDGTDGVQLSWTQLQPQTQERLRSLSTITETWPLRVVELAAGVTVVLDMPALGNTNENSVLWGRIAYSAYNPVYGLLHTTENGDWLNPTQIPLTTCLSVHTEIGADVIGASVGMAQSRAVGRPIVWAVEDYNSLLGENSQTITANINTKIFVSSDQKAHIVFGDTLETFTPHLSYD